MKFDSYLKPIKSVGFHCKGTFQSLENVDFGLLTEILSDCELSNFWCHEATRLPKPGIHNILNPTPQSSNGIKLQKQKRKARSVSFALAETAASVAIAATVVGAAATLLVRRTQASETNEVHF